ncbi:MAG TPA: PDDEXK nuclease domain-containing protein [Terracidiphilus sp.]|jgi:predicted nuclease of restriction endonuclease-like (RecB) superfamily
MIKRRDSSPLYEDIRTLVRSARQNAARGVDLLQVYTNYEIGRRIFEHEQKGADRAGYGTELLNELASRLTGEFGGGFSRTNLASMRQFYVAYPGRVPKIIQTASGQFPFLPVPQVTSGQALPSQIVQTLPGQFTDPANTSHPPFLLSWSHYVFLIGLKEEQRSFYEIEAAQQGWTLRELRRQFDAGLYERLALSRDKHAIRDLSHHGHHVTKPQDLLKDPYVLEFLGLEEKARYSESDLESAIVTHIEHFLLELGKGFLFEARQKRFTFDEEHFFVDLVFYNRLLRAYVLIDLKIGKLTHQDLGQMQMYVNYFDRHVKTEAENHTIGIVLCKKKNSALVEITLPKDANIHAREYQLYLPSKEELQQKLVEWMGEQDERKE